MRLKQILTAITLLGLYYYLIYFFVLTPFEFGDELLLRDRFGTTIWHTSDKGGEEHVYCYYPGKDIDHGGYVLKRVANLDDCNGWYGTAILYEGKWASEKEKYL